MELTDLLQPLNEELLPDDILNRNRIGETIEGYFQDGPFPDLSNYQLALVGVPEDRNAVINSGSASAPDVIREELYALHKGAIHPRIVDLGNLKRGHTPEDTYFALATVLADLISQDIIPIVIGGSQDLTFGQYKAYQKLGQIINLVSIDPRFDLGDIEGELDNQSFLSRIILHKPNYLFNYTNIGYQSYYIDQDAVNLLKNLLFDAYRIGVIRDNLETCEPLIRNADIISVDMAAIRMAEAPGNARPSPNGFYGEEICQIMRYAGRSDKLSSIGIYEYSPAFDPRKQTAGLIAQMIWYLLEGFAYRTNDLPAKGESPEDKHFVRYMVTIEDHEHEIEFLKSKKSDRWWMEVPCPPRLQQKYDRQFLVPCSYQDYQEACRNEIPEKWWQVYQKFV